MIIDNIVNIIFNIHMNHPESQDSHHFFQKRRRPAVVATATLLLALSGHELREVLKGDPQSVQPKKENKSLPQVMEELIQPNTAPIIETMAEAAPTPTLDLEELESSDEILSFLRDGGEVLTDSKYIRIHQETDGTPFIVIGFGYDDTRQTGLLYSFADPDWQKEFRSSLDGKSEHSLSVGFGEEPELMKKLKVKDPSHRQSHGFRISINNFLLQVMGRDQLIVPLSVLSRDILSLANYRLDSQPKEIDVELRGFTPDGKLYGENIKLRYEGEYDPKLRARKPKMELE